MKTWLMADPHFGHGRYASGIVHMMSRVRPGTKSLFGSIDEHDAYLIDEINSTVERGDRLIIGGDFCWGNPEEYRKKIKCKNVDLVLGNHDNKGQCKRCFRNVYDILTLKVNCQGWSQSVTISHYPLAFWEKSYAGSVHFYGHCHGMVEARMDLAFPGRRSMDIGVDNLLDLTGCYKPVEAKELVCMVLERRAGHDDLEPYNTYRDRRFEEKTK